MERSDTLGIGHVPRSGTLKGFYKIISCTTAIAVFCMAGCRKTPTPTSQPAGKPQPITKTAKRGPVEVTLTADRGELPYTERLKLRLEVKAKRQVTVEMPNYGRLLGERPFELRVRDYKETDTVPIDEQTLRWTRDFELEFFVSGDYEIPAATISFVDDRPDGVGGTTRPGEPRRFEVSTEPFTVKVRSPSERELSLDQLAKAPALSPVELPAPPRHWAWYAVPPVGAAVLAGAVLLVRVMRRRAARLVTVRMSPQEWAYARLQAIIDEDLVGQGRIQDFYYRLSDVVRGYIELRFGLHAPERTTEEFLAEIAANPALPEEHKRSLAPFLQACDMVKFARYDPEAREIEAAFNSAREFVDRTAETAVTAVKENAAVVQA